MTPRPIIKATLGAALTFVLQVNSVSAQNGLAVQAAPRSSPVVSEVTYNRVLNILFPPGAAAANRPVWSIVLRFRPSLKPESQIVVRRDENKAEVIEYTAPDGAIYDRLNEILARNGKEDAVEMAKAIRVRRREISVPYAQVKRWYSNLFDSIASTSQALNAAGEEFDRTGAESVVLDGTSYDFWYEHLLNKMSFSLYDVEIDKPGSEGEFKLVQWMNGVRRDVERLKLSQAVLEGDRPRAERVQQILRGLEPDNTLRMALERGHRGSGVRYAWMDKMRQHGIRQASFSIHFRRGERGEELQITDVKYLRRYYRFDTAMEEQYLIEQVRASGLEEELSKEIRRRASADIAGKVRELGSSQLRGTLYLNLLDDEALPVLDEPADLDDGAGVTAGVEAGRAPRRP